MENFLFDAIARLAKVGVDFVICGGVACILQGSNRNSFDLDISIDMNEANLKKLIQDIYDIQMLEELLHETSKR